MKAIECSNFASILKAITSGKYVLWQNEWSKGFVLAVEDPEWLVMTTNGGYPPFKSGFDQAIANNYKFFTHDL